MMNRSFRAPEKVMPRQQMGFNRKSVVKEKEEELGLFLEMKKRDNLLLNNTHDDDYDDLSMGIFFFYYIYFL